MPNWCSNHIQLSGKKVNQLVKFLDKNQGKNFFDFFVPPAKENDDNWYSYNQENYGCKWNCDANDWVKEDEEVVTVIFDSPWCPPLALFEKMFQEGWDVDAKYYEPGMCFVGHWYNGDDDVYEYADEDVLSVVPEYLVEFWGLDEQEEFDE